MYDLLVDIGVKALKYKKFKNIHLSNGYKTPLSQASSQMCKT